MITGNVVEQAEVELELKVIFGKISGKAEKYDRDNLQLAVACTYLQLMSLGQAFAEFNVPKSTIKFRLDKLRSISCTERIKQVCGNIIKTLGMQLIEEGVGKLARLYAGG